MMTKHAQARNGSKILHPEQLEEFEQRLRRRKAFLTDDILGLSREESEKSEADAAHSNHMAESGTDTFEEDVRLLRMESAGDEMEEIEAALERIRQDSFGTCEECAKPIPIRRLRAIPYARLCIPCKEAEEAA